MHPDPLDELHAEGALQPHRRDLPDADRLPAGPRLAFRPARAADPGRLPDRRLPHLQAEAARRRDASLRRDAAAAPGIERDRQGRRRRLPRQGLRPLPPLPGPEPADRTQRPGTPGRDLARATRRPLRTPQGPERLAARTREGGRRLRPRRVLREGLRPRPLRQGASSVRPLERERRDAQALRQEHLRPGRADGKAADRGRHPLRPAQLARGGQRQPRSRLLGHPRRQLRAAQEPALPRPRPRAVGAAIRHGRPRSARRDPRRRRRRVRPFTAPRRQHLGATATPRTAATTGPTATPLWSLAPASPAASSTASPTRPAPPPARRRSTRTTCWPPCTTPWGSIRRWRS